MKIHDQELSPFPGLLSTKVTRLTFSKREIAALESTVNILREADRMLASHYDDIDHPWHVALCPGYIEDLISENPINVGDGEL